MEHAYVNHFRKTTLYVAEKCQKPQPPFLPPPPPPKKKNHFISWQNTAKIKKKIPSKNQTIYRLYL